MFDLEEWFENMLKTIASCRDNNVDEYKLVLNKEQIKMIADAYDKLEWIELY